MKTPALILVLAGTATAAPPVLAPTSPDSLARMQAIDPLARYVRPAADPAAAASQRPSVIRQSTLLHDGIHWTMVPEGALIHIPAALKSRVGAAPTGTLMPWLDFLAQNRAWLTTAEVSLDQAAGKEPLPAQRAGFWKQQDKIVVAVHLGGPISLRPMDPQPLASTR